jgi:Mg-chelatase subunit ChlD
MTAGKPAAAELFAIAERTGRDRIASVLIDVVEGQGRGVEMRRLAALLGACYLRVRDLRPRHILAAVSQTPAASA